VNASALLATFDTEAALIDAARAVDAAGFTITDAYGPYLVAGLPSRVAAGPSRIALACLCGGVMGAAGGLLLQAWTSAASWPLDVGGKPVLAWLAYLPVAFELMILGAGAAAVAMFLVECRLRPRRRLAMPPGSVTGGRFAIAVEAGSVARLGMARATLRDAGAAAVVSWAGDEVTGAGSASAGRFRSADRALIAVTCASAGLAALLWPDWTRRNVSFAPDMAISPAATTHSPAALQADGRTLLTPVPGTVPRGPLPLRYEATEADALRAAAELQVPTWIAAETDWARAEKSFAAFCQLCHGSEGHGDGITIKRGFQPPPSLLTQRARDMKDGQMFHVITYGQKLMPSHASQVGPDDRWRLILHVRRLQQRLPVDPPPFGSASATASPPP